METHRSVRTRRLTVGSKSVTVLDDEMSRNYEDLTPVSRVLAQLPLPPNPTVLDIGANIGIMSLAFATHFGPGCKVHAFEPHRVTFETLRRNVGLEANLASRVEVFDFGFSDRRETCYLSMPTPAQHRRYDPKESQPNIGLYSVKGDGAERFECHLITVDEFVEARSVRTIDLMKIDVEGVEYEVLSGGEKSIGKCRPCMLLEYNELTRALSDHGCEEYWEFFERHGYNLFGLSRNWNTKMANVRSVNDLLAFHDLICIPRERAVLVDGGVY